MMAMAGPIDALDTTHENDDEQSRLWNGPSGRAWVAAQPLLDRMYRPFEALLVDAVAAASGCQVLDVGCGTGSTTLAVARLLGAKGRCTGIDVSGPMIAAARVRAEQEGSAACFVHANAQAHAFEPASFDTIMSRFGVMFFDDPIRAFANLRRAASEGGTLTFVAWRSPAENPFMTAAERAAAPLLPNLPARRPGAPGQFAFADSDRVHAILDGSGWTAIAIRPLDVDCVFPEADLVPYLTGLGPVGSILRDADDRTRTQVIDAVRPAFDPYVYGADVRFTAACWMVGARAGRSDDSELRAGAPRREDDTARGGA
jgi:SAM-dependent methyltransferase